jgi:hypothetical protein
VIQLAKNIYSKKEEKEKKKKKTGKIKVPVAIT